MDEWAALRYIGLGTIALMGIVGMIRVTMEVIRICRTHKVQNVILLITFQLTYILIEMNVKYHLYFLNYISLYQ